MKKNIESYNDKGELHGYWEFYWDGVLWYKSYYINTQLNGYSEEHYTGKLKLIFHL